MAWKWFRFLRVPTKATLPSLNEASPAWSQDNKRLNVHDGTSWKEIAFRSDLLAGTYIDSALQLTPSESCPVVPVWDSDHDISSANYPVLVPLLRAQAAPVYDSASGAYYSSFTGTVSGSVFTGPAAASGAGNAFTNLLAGLLEEEAAHGSYASWRCINLGGVDYQITLVNQAARTITVSGTPTAGSSVAIFYPHRIAGSTSTARTFKDSGRALMSGDGLLHIAGLRRRDHMQGHYHSLYAYVAAYTAGVSGSLDQIDQTSNALPGNGTTRARSPITDSTNGVPRTDQYTEPSSTITFRYINAVQYVA